MTPDNTFVVICDWQGRIVWKSSSVAQSEIGDYAWSDVDEECVLMAKESFAKTISLRESGVIEIKDSLGSHFRIWMWPLNAPDSAACLLYMQIPKQLSLLTDRELECLQLLAQGFSTKNIADELEISLSTSQTHLKRSREKLGVKTAEALVSFAARFCNPNAGPLSTVDVVK